MIPRLGVDMVLSVTYRNGAVTYHKRHEMCATSLYN